MSREDRYEGDKPEDPDRNTVITKPGTKSLETIREQCEAPGTKHHEKMGGPADIVRHSARDYTLVTEVDAGDIVLEDPRLSTWPNELSVPWRIDATDTDTKMDPTDMPRWRRRLNQAGRHAGTNSITRSNMDYKGPDGDHKVHIRRDTPEVHLE